MYMTTFVRKQVKGKPQWVCMRSLIIYEPISANKAPLLAELYKNKFLPLPFLRQIISITGNKVHLGSCKRPHKYIKFGE